MSSLACRVSTVHVLTAQNDCVSAVVRLQNQVWPHMYAWADHLSEGQLGCSKRGSDCAALRCYGWAMVCRSVVMLQVMTWAHLKDQKPGRLTSCCACMALQRAQGTPAEPQVTTTFRSD